MFDFSGQTVIVSGGTSGINLGIADSFARAGANLFVFSRDPEKVTAAIEQLSGHGIEADGCSTDVRNYDDVAAAFDKCVKKFGEIDVVVSGAAGNFPCLSKNLSSNGFRAVMEIDLLGTHHVMHAAYPHLKKPGGSVINVSSAHSETAMIGQSHVCAAKAGIDQITRTLALEWGPDGIRINSILPGPIAGSGGMNKLFPTEELMQAKMNSVPLRRLGTNDDIGNLCLFVSSELGSYITGTAIPCDGGSGLNFQPTRYEEHLNR